MLSIRKFLPGIAWFFLILILISIPGKLLPSHNSFLELIYFDKWVHFSLFAILAFLFLLPIYQAQPKNRSTLITLVVFGSIAWGLLTECIQHFLVVNRSFDLWDWAADSFGVTIAFFYLNKKYSSTRI
jgi:VanZ family protein